MSEVIQAAGLAAFVVGVFLNFGVGWGLMALGPVLYFVGEAVDR